MTVSDFISATGMDLESSEALTEARFYTSHESLLLNYDACLHPSGQQYRRILCRLGPYAVDRRPHPQPG